MTDPRQPTTTDGVLDWAVDVTINDPADAAARVVHEAHALATAMRLRAVWDEHRDKLVHVSDRRRYNTINRKTINNAVQAFCAAMQDAEKEPQ